MQRINQPSISAFLLVFFLTTVMYSQAQTGNANNVQFLQGNNVYVISGKTDSISLERKAFSIRFFCRKYDEKKEKFYATQIAVLDKADDTAFASIGKKIADIPYFESGTGMAPGWNNRYDTIFITNSGHNYIYYENEKENRATLLAKSKDLLELEWNILSASYEEKFVQFSELKLPELYFVILIDDNLNELIDEGELKIIKVKFKD